MMLLGKGHYLGTCIDGRWWRRYGKDKMFARGSGNWRLDHSGLYFHRYLTRQPMFIPFDFMHGVELAKWHAGRWAGGRPIMVVHWNKGGQRLDSGFVLAKDSGRINEIAGRIQQTAGRGPGAPAGIGPDV